MSPVTVNRRNAAIEIPELGLRCDQTEMPHPMNRERADRYFIGVGETRYGKTRALGTIATALFGSQVAFIVAPLSDREPSHWMTLELADCTVTTEGSAGVLKKRPVCVEIRSADVVVRMSEIDEFFPVRRAVQRHRSSALVAALRTGSSAGVA